MSLRLKLSNNMKSVFYLEMKLTTGKSKIIGSSPNCVGFVM